MALQAKRLLRFIQAAEHRFGPLEFGRHRPARLFRLLAGGGEPLARQLQPLVRPLQIRCAIAGLRFFDGDARFFDRTYGVVDEIGFHLCPPFHRCVCITCVFERPDILVAAENELYGPKPANTM